jgi:phage shock protein A
MKKFIAIGVLTVLPWAANAQGQLPVNAEVVAYQQLLTEANDRLAKTAGKVQQLEVEIQNLRSKISTIETKKPEVPPKSEQK